METCTRCGHTQPLEDFPCNRGIGYLADCPDRLGAAFNHLEGATWTSQR